MSHGGGEDRAQETKRERRAPICPWCGVTALPGTAVGSTAAFVCDNEDCPAYSEAIG